MRALSPLFCSLPALFASAALSLPAIAQDDDYSDVLEEVVVTGQASQVELTPTYAGDQVARGGRAGLLGNLDFMDAPFTGTAFTQQLIEAQQSDSVGDVLQNDPVVRVAKGFGNFQEVYVVRGFPVYSDDLTLNGLFGILPRQYVAAELLERVEVFRGANAFINGAAPGGSGVGGTINLVPKRAPESGVLRGTLGYENASQLYAAVDVGERFGAADAWGVRFNAALRDGETSVDGQDRDMNVFSIGTDYAGERFRFSADLGWQDNRIDAPRPQVTPLGEIPEPPSADTNYAQPWTFSDEEQLFGVVRGEFDFTDRFSGWVAVGGREGEENNVLANPRSDADGNLSAYRFDNVREDSIFSADAGLRAAFDTGAVGHSVVLSGSVIDTDSKNAYAFSSFVDTFASNLYNPVAVAPPTPDFFVGGDMSNPLTTEKVNNKSLALADTLAFMDGQLLVTVGLRHQDIETQSFNYNTGALLSGYADDKVSPAGGIVWRLGDAWSLYGNYMESLQPGAIAPASSGGVPIENAGEVLEPFTGEQAEIGVKWDGGDFGGTASLFTLDRPNAIVVDNVFQASGDQRNTGVELSVFGEPVPGLRLLGGATWVDAELKRTQDGIDQGNAVIGVPEFQTNLNVDWTIPGTDGLIVDGRVVYTGDQYVNTANTIELDAWTRLDIGARYVVNWDARALTFRLRVDNVTDESYWASTGGFPGANYLILGSPRTYAVSASIDF